eukprot:gnl/MRDRNA2_/MRDRNA2_26737_c0_seq1.p1 gnl/MRDRNA2_/MRDRNA2_26737_c0~~gnl/MRDRNA2_/MRDRNA2_26737_c0_seq1.p1  ORF type:complete len:239 (-),score=27.23 gnl/MRDRNA2_/MRDRNA2_26737_c0_seq1:43-702(-)
MEGKKFDVRLYMLAARFGDPWMIFYCPGYVRRSMDKYASKTKHANLTNSHLQKKHPQYNPEDHAWSFEYWDKQLSIEYPGRRGWVKSVFEPEVKRVMKFWFDSRRQLLEDNIKGLHWMFRRKKHFTLLGFDIFVSSSWKIYLIEVNLNPGTGEYAKWQGAFEKQRLSSLFELVLLLNDKVNGQALCRKMQVGDSYNMYDLIERSDSSDVKKPGSEKCKF